MARNPSTPDCSIAGCTRAVHKGKLCAKHYKMVPREEITRTMFACATAAAYEARKAHKRQLGIVRRLIREQAA